MQVRVVSSNMQVLTVSLQHLTVKGYGLFLFVSLNPQFLPHSLNIFCIVFFHIFFLSLFGFLCMIGNLSYAVSLLSHLSSDDDSVEIIGAQ